MASQEKVSIGPAHLSEVSELVAIERRGTVGDELHRDWPTRNIRYSDMIVAPEAGPIKGRVLAARRLGQVVGFAVVTLVDSDSKPRGRLDGPYVDPFFNKHNNIGHGLVGAAEKQAYEWGAIEMEAWLATGSLSVPLIELGYLEREPSSVHVPPAETTVQQRLYTISLPTKPSFGT